MPGTKHEKSIISNYDKAKKDPLFVGKWNQLLWIQCPYCKTDIGKIELRQKLYLIKAVFTSAQIYCIKCKKLIDLTWPDSENKLIKYLGSNNNNDDNV